MKWRWCSSVNGLHAARGSMSLNVHLEVLTVRINLKGNCEAWFSVGLGKSLPGALFYDNMLIIVHCDSSS